MAKLKIEDLKKIKEKVHSETALREGFNRVKVTVHMGTCGIASGAKEVMDSLMGEIEEAKVVGRHDHDLGLHGTLQPRTAGHGGNSRPGTDQV